MNQKPAAFVTAFLQHLHELTARRYQTSDVRHGESVRWRIRYQRSEAGLSNREQFEEVEAKFVADKISHRLRSVMKQDAKI